MIKKLLKTLLEQKTVTVDVPEPSDGYLSVGDLSVMGQAMSVLGPFLVAGLNNKDAGIVIGQEMAIKRNQQGMSSVTLTQSASLSSKDKDVLLLCVDSLIASINPPIDSRCVAISWLNDTLATVEIKPSAVQHCDYSLSGVEWRFKNNDSLSLKYHKVESPTSHNLPQVLNGYFAQGLRRVMQGKHPLLFPLNVIAARVTTEGWLTELPNQFYLSTSDNNVVSRLVFTSPDNQYKQFYSSVISSPKFQKNTSNQAVFPSSYLEPSYFLNPITVLVAADSIGTTPVGDGVAKKGVPELHGVRFIKLLAWNDSEKSKDSIVSESDSKDEKKKKKKKISLDLSTTTTCVSTSQLTSVLQSGLAKQESSLLEPELDSHEKRLQDALVSIKTPKKSETVQFPHSFSSIPVENRPGNNGCYTSLVEGETIEFKPIAFLNKNLRKTINSFVNSKGGSLFIGIKDNGLIEGFAMTVSDKDKFVKDCHECCAAMRPIVPSSALKITFHPHPADTVSKTDIKEWWKKKPSTDSTLRCIPEVSVSPQRQWPFYFLGPKSGMVRMRRLASSDIMPYALLSQRYSDWLSSCEETVSRTKSKKQSNSGTLKRMKKT